MLFRVTLAVLLALLPSVSFAQGSPVGRSSPPPMVGVAAEEVAAGAHHACAVVMGGGVKCWGDNTTGQLGDGTFTSSGQPVDVFGLATGIAEIVAGEAHTCALTNAGGVKCWGDNYYGQSGGTAPFYTTPSNVSGLSSGVAALTAGDNHTCAKMVTGGVKCWGSNAYGQIGDNTTNQRNSPTDIDPSTAYASVSAGGGHTCGVTTAGAAKCWGLNGSGQLGDNSTTNRLVPTPVSGLASGVSGITAGGLHTCAVTTTSVAMCWGSNADGRLGDGSATQRLTPVPVSGLSTPGVSPTLVFGAAGRNHTCVVTDGGTVKCWGRNEGGALGDGTTTARLVPADVLNLSNAVAVDAGLDYTCARTTGGGLRCWGVNASGQLGSGPPLRRLTPGSVLQVTAGSVSAGGSQTCAKTADGAAACWGYNHDGQLGDSTTEDRGLAGNVAGLSGVQAVSAGQDHSCAILGGGAAKCWGANYTGQLGNGTFTRSAVPVSVSTLESGVTAIAAGGFHTCALTTGGAVKCWGDNTYGQLGDNSTTRRTSPVPVEGLSSGVVAIAAGTNHSCAALSGGAVKCWGDNTSGQLGDDSLMQRLTPVDVTGFSGALASTVTAGVAHSCALMTTGGIKCWGSNNLGQLGDGTLHSRSTAFDVPALRNGVTSVDAGDYHTCAVLDTGAVMCWGNNDSGQIGDGTTEQRLYPTAGSGITGATAVSAGGSHSCALLSGGGVQCWGWDYYGQLGVGRLLAMDVPASVVGFTRGAAPAFTDDPLVAQTTTIKASHVNELHIAVDLLRTGSGLAPFLWTDATVTAGTVPVRAIQLLELRSALAAAYTAAGFTPPSYATGAIAAGVTVLAAHVAELRAAVVGLW